MRYILIVSFLCLSFLYGESVDIPDRDYETKSYQDELDRQHMLRQAKYLKRKYEDSSLKLQNWEFEKERLIEEFNRKNSFNDTAFGEGNEYGKLRAKRRKDKFYKSLKSQEQHLIDSFIDVEMKLNSLKDEFMFRFSVPLTEQEISSGVKPPIEDRDIRVEMLREYISESRAYKSSRDMILDIDRVKGVVSSIERIFPEKNITISSVEDRESKNQIAMQKHLGRFLAIDEEYKLKYGIPISTKERAKYMLEYMKKN